MLLLFIFARSSIQNGIDVRHVADIKAISPLDFHYDTILFGVFILTIKEDAELYMPVGNALNLVWGGM